MPICPSCGSANFRQLGDPRLFRCEDEHKPFRLEEVVKLAEKEKPKKKTLTVKITLPTKETVIKALTAMFPGIEVEVEEEKPSEETPSED